MPKIKCGDGRHGHGGFHLCVGPAAPSELLRGPSVHVSTKSEAAHSRWERYWAANRERDQGIHDIYMSGSSLSQVAEKYNLSKITVKSIVLRLGGEMRARNSGHNHLKKENA